MQSKAPQIATYQFDSSFHKVSYVLAPMALLSLLPGPTSLLGPVAPTYNTVEFVRENVIGPTGLIYFWGIWFSVHSVESLYTLHLCRKSKTPLGATVSSTSVTWLTERTADIGLPLSYSMLSRRGCGVLPCSHTFVSGYRRLESTVL